MTNTRLIHRFGGTVHAVTLAWLVATLLSAVVHAQTTKALVVPSVDEGVLYTEQRAAKQRARSPQIKPFHDFSFSNQLESSGIKFVHRPTLDGTSHYKMVHYDHGNSVSVADVDGDAMLDIYFVSQQGSNELWRNKGNGTYENTTSLSPGLAMDDVISVAASFADVDNDGDADLYVTTVNMGNRMFRNQGNGRFEDITKHSATGHTAHSSGSVFFDYDRDGLLDLFVTNVGRYTETKKGEGDYYIGLTDAFSGHRMPERAESSILYRNLGQGRFKDVSQDTGLNERGWNGDASFADLDRDGFLDLYVLNMQGDDGYWKNKGGSTFLESGASTFPKTPWGAMGIKFFDWDNDNDLDLLITDMHSDMSVGISPAQEERKSFMTWDEEHLQGGANNIFGNAFFRNDNGSMTEVSDQVGAENYWPWGVSVGDLNADGFEDAVLTSSMNYPFRYLENSVLLNNAGKNFERAEYLLGIEPRTQGPTKNWFEMDCPPGPDTAPAPLGAIEVMLKQCGFRKGKTQIVGTRGTRTAAIFDLDGDGDQDLVTGEFHDVPQVFISDLSERKKINYIKIKLVGTKSNRDGLGAMVAVKAGDQTFYRHYDGKLGYLGQSSHPIFVGLGDRKKVDSIVVRWPSGTVQTVSQVSLNGTVTVSEED